MTVNIPAAFDQLPLWASIPVLLLLLLGGVLVLIGALGLVRLSNFYQRLHGPAMINTLGAGCVLIASMIYFSALEQRFVFHEIIITFFVLFTSPVTAMLLMRAAVYRDRRSHRNEVPPQVTGTIDDAEDPEEEDPIVARQAEPLPEPELTKAQRNRREQQKRAARAEAEAAAAAAPTSAEPQSLRDTDRDIR